MRHHRIILTTVFSIGCHHEVRKAETPVAPAPVPAGAASSASSAAALPAADSSVCRGDISCPEGHLCIDGRCTLIHPGQGECALARVHFDFNDSMIKPDEATTLQRMARCLKADHRMRVEIRGNADERGTEEYNLALGDRRAQTVATYLTNLGVSSAQLSTVSFGKLRPLCTEHTEACWQENRRAGLAPSAMKR